MWKFIKNIFRPKPRITVQELSDKYKGDLVGLGYWIVQHITYRSDRTPQDEFRTAFDTLKLGYGDCEDFAVLASNILAKWGEKPYLLTFYPVKGDGHCICAVKYPRRWYYLDNGNLHDTYISNNDNYDLKSICNKSAEQFGWKVGRAYIVDCFGTVIETL